MAFEEVCVLHTECVWRNVMCKMSEIRVAELRYNDMAGFKENR